MVFRDTSQSEVVSGVTRTWSYPVNAATGTQETLAYGGSPETSLAVARSGREQEATRTATIASGVTVTRAVSARDAADRWTSLTIQKSGASAQTMGREFDDAGRLIERSGFGLTTAASHTYDANSAQKTAESLPFALGGSLSNVNRGAGLRCLAALVTIVALLTVVAGCGSPRAQSTPTDGPSSGLHDPAAVAAGMAAAMSSVTSLSGTTYDRLDGGTVTGTFACDAAGSYGSVVDDDPAEARRTGVNQPVASFYEAHRHRIMFTYRRPDGRLDCDVWDDAWPYEDPMGVPNSGGACQLGDVWYVRAALAEDAPGFALKLIEFDGRPAWRVTYDFNDQVEGEALVIDRQTGFPVAFEVRGSQADTDEPSGYTGYSSSLIDLRVNEELPADAFAAEPPAGSRLAQLTERDYYCRLGEVADRVGYAPFVPAPDALPAGYRLREVATSDRTPGDFFGWSEPDGRFPHRAQFLRYRHGLNSFTVQVSTLLGAAERREVAGEIDSPSRGDLPAERPLAGGAFAGRRAHTWLNGCGANLMVYDDRYAVFITGALTRAQLYQVAEGLVQK